MSDLFTEPILPKIPVRLRLGTMLLDHAIICFTCLPAIFLLKTLIYPGIEGNRTSELFILPVFVIYFCKDCIQGRSLAKRMLKLSIVDHSSNVVATPVQSVIRNLLIVVWPIEVLVACFNQERRIGDHLAGTKLTYNYNPAIVVHKIDPWQLVMAISIAIVYTLLLFALFSTLY
jgi:uncharacterized RDD family membrane protein YckC